MRNLFLFLTTIILPTNHIRHQPQPTNLFVTIVTGDDDLRGDSQAQMMFFSGQSDIHYQTPGDVMEFKSQGSPGWANGTTHCFQLTIPGEIELANMNGVIIKLTSHNSWSETDDNWNIKSLCIDAFSGPKDNPTLVWSLYAGSTNTKPAPSVPAPGVYPGTEARNGIPPNPSGITSQPPPHIYNPSFEVQPAGSDFVEEYNHPASFSLSKGFYYWQSQMRFTKSNPIIFFFF